MIVIFVILAIPVAAILLFRTIMRSQTFNRVCTSIFGPDDASDVIESLDRFEQLATSQAEEEARVSEVKRKNSEAIRKRVRRDTFAPATIPFNPNSEKPR
jgi:hypothetical protein